MNNITITPINTGMVSSSPKNYLYHHSVHKFYADLGDEDILLPVYVFLIDTGNELLLVDTGMCDTERANKYHHPNSYQAPGQAIDRALKGLGYECGEITKIIFTHLHWDHVSNMGKFKNAAYYAQRQEYEFANAPIPLYFKSYENPALGIGPSFKGLRDRFVLINGEAEIVPGVRVFPSPGHSAGHQCVEVDTADGSYILAGDALFLQENLKSVPSLHYTVTPPGRFSDIVSWYRSAEEIKSRADSAEMVLPCHEPSLIERFARNPVLGLGQN